MLNNLRIVTLNDVWDVIMLNNLRIVTLNDVIMLVMWLRHFPFKLMVEINIQSYQYVC